MGRLYGWCIFFLIVFYLFANGDITFGKLSPEEQAANRARIVQLRTQSEQRRAENRARQNQSDQHLPSSKPEEQPLVEVGSVIDGVSDFVSGLTSGGERAECVRTAVARFKEDQSSAFTTIDSTSIGTQIKIACQDGKQSSIRSEALLQWLAYIGQGYPNSNSVIIIEDVTQAVLDEFCGQSEPRSAACALLKPDGFSIMLLRERVKETSAILHEFDHVIARDKNHPTVYRLTYALMFLQKSSVKPWESNYEYYLRFIKVRRSDPSGDSLMVFERGAYNELQRQYFCVIGGIYEHEVRPDPGLCDQD